MYVLYSNLFPPLPHSQNWSYLPFVFSHNKETTRMLSPVLPRNCDFIQLIPNMKFTASAIALFSLFQHTQADIKNDILPGANLRGKGRGFEGGPYTYYAGQVVVGDKAYRFGGINNKDENYYVSNGDVFDAKTGKW